MSRALLLSSAAHLRPVVGEPLDVLGIGRIDHADHPMRAVSLGRSVQMTGETLSAIVVDASDDLLLAFDFFDVALGEPWLADVPVIVLIERSAAASIDILMASGATDVVLSPFSPPELKLRIQLAQRLKAEERERHAVSAVLEELKLNGASQRRILVPLQGSDLPAIDPTTGLFNRAAAEAMLRVLSAGGNQRLRFSVVAISVDALGGYAESQGAGAVRPLLRATAEALLALEAPLGSVVFRYDDDTLVVLILNAAVGRTASLARACFEAVNGMRWQNPGSPISRYVTTSIGFASGLVPTEMDVTEIIGNAIGAMERASAQGGNRMLRGGPQATSLMGM